MNSPPSAFKQTAFGALRYGRTLKPRRPTTSASRLMQIHVRFWASVVRKSNRKRINPVSARLWRQGCSSALVEVSRTEKYASGVESPHRWHSPHPPTRNDKYDLVFNHSA